MKAEKIACKNRAQFHVLNEPSCRISTPEQLFVFARATAEKELESGGIAVIVPSKAR